MNVRISSPVMKIKLKEPMAIEELYNLMTESQTTAFPRRFKLKGGLLGKSIQFDVYLQVQPTITVKDHTITIRRIEKSTSVGGIDFKAMSQSIGGLAKGDFSSGVDYFMNVYDRVCELLGDRIQ
ncbi:hypothetical protein LJC56_10500 [Christensenellaceae bacterium OttesenSCG-928-K19]|nr:hypothetical protein [Christensenellaceae bacterium OttesenSCG-928-K19]